jgi:hypothetical protein
MRFYNQQHRFYCGIDLHARSMIIHIFDASGKTCFEQGNGGATCASVAVRAPGRVERA